MFKLFVFISLIYFLFAVHNTKTYVKEIKEAEKKGCIIEEKLPDGDTIPNIPLRNSDNSKVYT